MTIFSAAIGNKNINIFYSHVPKTAGTSVSHFFQKIGFTQRFGNENKAIRPLMKIPPQHYTYATINDLFDLNLFQYCFAISRNPYARLVSDYKWAMTSSTMRDQPMAFEDWVNFCLDRYQHDRNYLANHFRPQTEFIGVKITNIFKIEDGLSNILEQVISGCHLKLDKPISSIIEVKNKSSFDQNDFSISEKTLARIVETYKVDFQEFDYDINNLSPLIIR